MIRLPPGAPSDQRRPAVLEHDRPGLIHDSGRLPGPGALAAPPTRRSVRAPGLAAKSSSVLVEQDAGRAGDQGRDR